MPVRPALSSGAAELPPGGAGLRGAEAGTFRGLPRGHGVMAEPVLFDKPGLVTMGCNIHDGMIAYLYVVDTPYFGLTAATGTVQLPDLDPGEYVLTAWHYQMTAMDSVASQHVTVTVSSPTIELSVALSDEQHLPPPLE